MTLIDLNVVLCCPQNTHQAKGNIFFTVHQILTMPFCLELFNPVLDGGGLLQKWAIVLWNVDSVKQFHHLPNKSKPATALSIACILNRNFYCSEQRLLSLKGPPLLRAIKTPPKIALVAVGSNQCLLCYYVWITTLHYLVYIFKVSTLCWSFWMLVLS